MTKASILNLKSQLSELDQLDEFVRHFIEVEDLLASYHFKLTLILEELLTNSILHGFGERDDGKLLLRLGRTEDEISIDIEDDAKAFDLFSVAPLPDTTSDIFEREIGGLGLLLVKKQASYYHYQRNEGKNLVTLRIKIE